MKLIVNETKTYKREMTIEEVLTVISNTKPTMFCPSFNKKITDAIRDMNFTSFEQCFNHGKFNMIGIFTEEIEREATPEEYIAWYFIRIKEQCDVILGNKHKNDDNIRCKITENVSVCMDTSNLDDFSKMLEGKQITLITK